ncbi:MAG: hypothetical protein IJA20_05970 [Methanocorpusculum sp.]|nr:hypothetical protein [Methanocorpusculum sp.]
MFRYFKKGDEFEVKQGDGSMKAYHFLGFSKDNPENITIESTATGAQEEVSTYWFNLQEIYIDGTRLQTFFVPIAWEVVATASIIATSLEEAMDIARDLSPLPDGSYVDGSLSLACDEADYIATYYNAPKAEEPEQYGPKCVCGCNRFYAHQQLYADVIVDGGNNFIGNGVDDNLSNSISESGKPYGPYTCIMCGREYDDLEDLEQ